MRKSNQNHKQPEMFTVYLMIEQSLLQIKEEQTYSKFAEQIRSLKFFMILSEYMYIYIYIYIYVIYIYIYIYIYQ